MSDYSFNKLQDKLDQLAQNYVREHPEFVHIAIQKDAALKGQPPEVVEQILACYPGVVAIAAHEAAHERYVSGKPNDHVIARQLAEAAHSRSGIDIHPGTKIGKNCFIDHGTGVIIGETAKIGADTLIYHDVTLGAYGNPEEKNPERLAHRHPEIGSHCTVSVGAKVLGRVKVGNHVTIGPNAVLFGNKLVLGNHVSVGTGAQVGDENQVADGVRIGAGAIIPRGVGVIDQTIPPYCQVSRGAEGQLQINVAIPQEFLNKIGVRRKGQESEAAIHYHI